MKAVVLKHINEPPEYTEVDVHESSENLVELDLEYASLNKRDFWISKGLYPGVEPPVILGSDGSGYYNSQRVLLNPSYDWGTEENYQSSSFGILGVPRNGTLCEKVMVRAEQIHPVPEHLSMEEAAALPLAGLTAFRALKKLQLQPAKNLFISGIGGGVALSTLVMGLAYGLNCYVSSSKEEKISRAIQLGASGGVNYKQENCWEKLKKISGGIDYVIDGAGGKGISDIMSLCHYGAKIVLYGGTSGNIPNINPQRIFWKQLSIIGTSMGSDTDFSEMLEFVQKHKITPVIDSVHDLKNAPGLIQSMSKNEQFGKYVIRIK